MSDIPKFKGIVQMVPGPVQVPKKYLDVYAQQQGSSDLESEFFDLYSEVSKKLKTMLYADASDVLVMSGEAMCGLWGTLRSIINPGERVLIVSVGVFGDGFYEMATTVGATAKLLKFSYENGIDSYETVKKEAEDFRPKMIIAVHCDTPSGILVDVEKIGEIAHTLGALYCVDFVSSAGGVPLYVDKSHIDIGLLGTQKALSLLPDLTIVTLSPKAWEAVESRKYDGFDAFFPWKNAVAEHLFPYTLNWNSIAALNARLDDLLATGMENEWKKHEKVAQYCQDAVEKLGLKLYPHNPSVRSSTCTAVYVPEGWTWPEWNAALRRAGLCVGGSYGQFTNKLFRIGHMGVQCEQHLVDLAVQSIREALASKATKVE